MIQKERLTTQEYASFSAVPFSSSYEGKPKEKEKLFTISYDLGSFYIMPFSGSYFEILKINCSCGRNGVKFYERCVRHCLLASLRVQ
jgi:hypothetical protein